MHDADEVKFSLTLSAWINWFRLSRSLEFKFWFATVFCLENPEGELLQ